MSEHHTQGFAAGPQGDFLARARSASVRGAGGQGVVDGAGNCRVHALVSEVSGNFLPGPPPRNIGDSQRAIEDHVAAPHESEMRGTACRPAQPDMRKNPAHRSEGDAVPPVHACVQPAHICDSCRVLAGDQAGAHLSRDGAGIPVRDGHLRTLCQCHYGGAGCTGEHSAPDGAREPHSASVSRARRDGNQYGDGEELSTDDLLARWN